MTKPRPKDVPLSRESVVETDRGNRGGGPSKTAPKPKGPGNMVHQRPSTKKKAMFGKKNPA